MSVCGNRLSVMVRSLLLAKDTSRYSLSLVLPHMHTRTPTHTHRSCASLYLLRSPAPPCRAVCAAFSDPAVVLRRTVANCLRQFSQVEPASVRRVASAALSGNLEELVVRRLDWEVHEGLVEDLKEVLLSLLSSLAPQDPMYWLQFCNRLLAASSEGKPLDLPGEGAEEEDEEAGALHTAREGEGEKAAAPNWQTRLFAMELVQKVYSSCRSNPAHFDQSLAVKQRQQTGGVWNS